MAILLLTSLFAVPAFQVITFILPSFSQIEVNQSLKLLMLYPGSSYSYSQDSERAPKSVSALLILCGILNYF